MILFEIGRDRKRSKFDIVIEILKICTESRNKTSIVYKSNLNFKVAGEYLQHLTDLGMITQEYQDNKKVFRTTEKGLEMLEKYSDLETTVR